MRTFRRGAARALLLLASGLPLTACAGSARWGSGAVVLPASDRVRAAAVAALTDPRTWVPAAGALVFGLSGLDERVADWASRETPLFGSRRAAADASDALVQAIGAGALATALATPSGCGPKEIAGNKVRGLLVEGAAVATPLLLTEALKDATNRLRPDGSSRTSFPSGHASLAFSGAALARRNLEWIRLDPRARLGLDGAFTAAAGLAAWARVEAARHHPSDVLAGAALGNALTLFVHDAFLGRAGRGRWTCGVRVAEEGTLLELTLVR